MKKLINISIVLPALMATLSCQQVIDLDLNEAEPMLVVEAKLTDQSGKVRLTRSVNFDEANEFPAVSGAQVTITADDGQSMLLSETAPGIYETAVPGNPGTGYRLNVVTGEREIEATGFMHQPVVIDSIVVDSLVFGAQASLYVRAYFTDIAGDENYYRIVEIINGDTLNTINLAFDQFGDGEQLTADIFSDMNPPLNHGDTVTLLLQSIDEHVFRYYTETILLINGAATSASPANPTTNLKGRALGFFSAESVRSATIVVGP